MTIINLILDKIYHEIKQNTSLFRLPDKYQK